MELFKVHPDNPQRRYLESVAEVMTRRNGIAIYPTDTVYGMGAVSSNAKGIDKISKIIHKDKSRLFSFICSDLAQVDKYVKVENWQYKIMKHYLPGPYTFILEATKNAPKKITVKRKTIGIRIPSNRVVADLVELLGEPIANTSLNIAGEHRGNPDMFDNTIYNDVDVMLDSGALLEPYGSTIVDLTSGEAVLVREGKGVFE